MYNNQWFIYIFSFQHPVFLRTCSRLWTAPWRWKKYSYSFSKKKKISHFVLSSYILLFHELKQKHPCDFLLGGISNLECQWDGRVLHCDGWEQQWAQSAARHQWDLGFHCWVPLWPGVLPVGPGSGFCVHKPTQSSIKAYARWISIPNPIVTSHFNFISWVI